MKWIVFLIIIIILKNNKNNKLASADLGLFSIFVTHIETDRLWHGARHWLVSSGLASAEPCEVLKWNRAWSGAAFQSEVTSGLGRRGRGELIYNWKAVMFLCAFYFQKTEKENSIENNYERKNDILLIFFSHENTLMILLLFLFFWVNIPCTGSDSYLSFK